MWVEIKMGRFVNSGSDGPIEGQAVGDVGDTVGLTLGGSVGPPVGV